MTRIDWEGWMWKCAWLTSHALPSPQRLSPIIILCAYLKLDTTKLFQEEKWHAHLNGGNQLDTEWGKDEEKEDLCPKWHATDELFWRGQNIIWRWHINKCVCSWSYGWEIKISRYLLSIMFFLDRSIMFFKLLTF